MINFLKKIFRNQVVFNSLQINTPISSVFGMDRGTPIDRYYIEKFLNSQKHFVKGTVLEVAEPYYTKKYGEKVSRIEILNAVPSDLATIVADLSKPDSLPTEKVDCFICTQTYNFIYDVKKAIEGSHRILKKDGVLLVTVAGLTQISRYDMDRWGDYWRFTDKSIGRMISEVFGVENVQVFIYGNVLAGIAFLQGIAVEDLPEPQLLDKEDNNYQITIGIVAKKSG